MTARGYFNVFKKVKKMAKRRMFAMTIVDSDAFLDMPLSTQALYFHLNMRADDDGFINNPKKIMRMINTSEDDFRVLIAKSFIINFDSGVVVIKHWRVHNLFRKDRHQKTSYPDEFETLDVKENGSYTKLKGCVQPNGNQVATSGCPSLVKSSLVKSVKKEELINSKIKNKISEYQNININAFNEWMDYKKYKSIAPVTKTLNFLDEYDFDTQQLIVNTSIMNQYQGLFPPKQNNQQPYNTPKSQTLNTDVNVWDEIDRQGERDEPVQKVIN